MIALTVVLGVVVALVTVLVAGLLRSHADILKALHDLGAGVGDPVGDTTASSTSGPSAGPQSVPLTMGPALAKGPEREIPGEVAALAAPGLSVLMSSDAWTDYEVPGSPFFVLVDGTSGRRVGEGVANQFRQVAELVRRAEVDAAAFTLGTRPGRDVGIDGPARESANDRELLDAGIRPGDPSLYPTSLDDLYGPPDARMPAAPHPMRRAG